MSKKKYFFRAIFANYTKINLVFLVIVFSSEISVAQHWKNWNTSNSNLITNAINSIAIDANNNVWLATNLGVTKFDGTNWTNYNSINSPIPNNVCYSIATEGNIIWIGSVWGLVKFDGGANWTIYNAGNSGLPYSYIVSIDIDRNGIKWIGTMDSFGTLAGGVTKFDGINWLTYNTSNSNLSSNWAFNTFVDRTNVKWISSLNGFDIYDDNLWINFIPNYSAGRIKEDFVDSLYWICLNSGIARYNRPQNLWSIFDTSNSLPSNYVFDVEIDSLNRKWISCYYSGIAMYDNISWTFFDSSNVGGFLKYPTNLSFDSRGGLWITTSSGLVYKGDTLLLLDDSKITKIDNNYFVEISPLPAHDFLNIKFNTNSNNLELLIYDINGKNICTSSIEYVQVGFTKRVDISHLSTGIYFVCIIFDKCQSIYKIVVSP